MDRYRHGPKDEHDTLNYEGFVRGFSDCLDQLVSDEYGNGPAFNPETQFPLSSTCVTEESLTTNASTRDSVRPGLLGIDWKVYSPRQEYLNLRARPVRNVLSNVWSLELTDAGISCQNDSTLSAPAQDDTRGSSGLNDSFRESRHSGGRGIIWPSPATHKIGCSVPVAEPKPIGVEPSVVGLAESETNLKIRPTSETPKHDGTHGVPGSDDRDGVEIFQDHATACENAYALPVPDRKSPVVDSSDLELAAPGISNESDTPPDQECPSQFRKLDDVMIVHSKLLMKDQISAEMASSYNLYLDKFEFYKATYRAGESLEVGVRSLRQMVQCKPLHFSKWTKTFKTEEIPKLLAGVSAVWSILVSKGISSDMVKPHFFQILCVLRLLGVDQSNGVSNHFAQVMSGEGKSLILALMSATLALTGHRVRVACYNNYLSSRDWQEFGKLFEVFAINDKICYGTFEDVANVFLKPTYNGQETSLHDLMKETLWHHTVWFGVLSKERKESVILIDELDVLFSPQSYGRTHWIDPRIELKGLDLVQENMWSLAQSKMHSPVAIYNLTKKFIVDAFNSGNSTLAEIKAFLDVEGEYALIDCQRGDHFVDRHTNKSLFWDHLMKMAEDANFVADSADDDAKYWFQINDEGLICCRDPSRGVYDERHFSSYKNTFNYFRFKKSGFDDQGSRNYGYLLIHAWQVSYARLPSYFPLILGVSGTLTSYSYEKSAIETYNVKTFSSFPRLYESKLKFSENFDFRCTLQEENWLQDIYESAKRVVENARAVLIVFKSCEELQVFRRKYVCELCSMRVLTEKELLSSLGNLYVTEAGAPCTVTLLTSDAARGVDYRPSSDVERAGGIHVIQTFFSLDVKEEAIIKGRAARLGDKGSYELIVCREQLVRDSVVYKDDSHVHTYSSLDSMRTKVMNEKGERISAEIAKNEIRHDTVMLFFGFKDKPSFKKSDPCCLS